MRLKVDNFIEDLSTCIAELCSRNETFFILGDININISPVNRSAAAKRYINMHRVGLWTALFRAFSSHRQPSASPTKLFPSWTRLLAELDKP